MDAVALAELTDFVLTKRQTCFVTKLATQIACGYFACQQENQWAVAFYPGLTFLC